MSVGKEWPLDDRLRLLHNSMLDDEFRAGTLVMSARVAAGEARLEIERLKGILHKVANRERELSAFVEKAHDATREVSDGFICGAFVELIDWYTFDE
jgi:hypothetical protein